MVFAEDRFLHEMHEKLNELSKNALKRLENVEFLWKTT